MGVSNPNGANQYQLDPRQDAFCAYYFNPKSPTFSNACQSALKAGYSQEYAESITTQNTTWFSEAMADHNRLKKAESVLDEMLAMPVQVLEYNKRRSDDDEDDEPESYLITEPAIVKIKQDTAKFVAERMGKHKYSQRVENTGPEGAPLIPSDESRNKAHDAIKTFLGSTTGTGGPSVTAP